MFIAREHVFPVQEQKISGIEEKNACGWQAFGLGRAHFGYRLFSSKKPNCEMAVIICST